MEFNPRHTKITVVGLGYVGLPLGNTTAASIPIALTEAWEEGKVKEGSKVVLAAFGSGFTWGSVMIQW